MNTALSQLFHNLTSSSRTLLPLLPLFPQIPKILQILKSRKNKGVFAFVTIKVVSIFNVCGL